MKEVLDITQLMERGDLADILLNLDAYYSCGYEMLDIDFNDGCVTLMQYPPSGPNLEKKDE